MIHEEVEQIKREFVEIKESLELQTQAVVDFRQEISETIIAQHEEVAKKITALNKEIYEEKKRQKMLGDQSILHTNKYEFPENMI